jgi:hypothetical protein
LAAICWVIWKLRNRTCFEHKLIKNPFELISYSTVFMKHWTGLHEGKDAEDIRAGADGLSRLAGAIASSDGNPATTDRRHPLCLMDTDRSEEGARMMEEDDQEDAAA